MPLRTKSQIPGLPVYIQRNDLDLLSRIKRREPAALGDLYDRHGKLVHSIIFRIVPDKDVTADLLVETFVTVWNQIGRWKDARIEDLRLWLLLLARNRAIEYLRSINEPLPKALPRAAALTQPSILQDFPRPRSNEQFTRLRETFSTLSERESRILEMASFAGMPLGDIAVHLGESITAVRETVTNILSKLAEAGHES